MVVREVSNDCKLYLLTNEDNSFSKVLVKKNSTYAYQGINDISANFEVFDLMGKLFDVFMFEDNEIKIDLFIKTYTIEDNSMNDMLDSKGMLS